MPPSHPAVTSGETGVPVLGEESDAISDAAAKSPDNTAVNQRDRNHKQLLPTDQGENEADLQTTAEIRRRIVDLSQISVDARNIKIITRNGKVTLRGPVASEQERQTLERIAHDVAGQDNVESQLEVTRS
jgi:osmotically-inducible protein OsmY